MLLRVIWAPIVIAALAIVGLLYQWPLEILVPVLSILLLLGIVMAVSHDRERKLERAATQLKGMAVYFVRRFAGNSSLTIFTVIESLYNIENPRLREWVRSCNASQTVFNAWCDGFFARVESDSRAGRLGTYMSIYLRELWSLIIQYQELVEQFCEVAEKAGVSSDTADQYSRFVTEYNPFAQRFRDYIGQLRDVYKTEIEPPSVKLARELSVPKPATPEPREKVKLPNHEEHKGYIIG